MFGFVKRFNENRKIGKLAEICGAAAAETILSKIDEYLDIRLPEVSNKLLDVLRERMKTIYDENDCGPEEVARIEGDIFYENISKYS